MEEISSVTVEFRRRRSFCAGWWLSVAGCWLAAASSAMAAEHAAITSARRALSEGIPQVAIYGLQGALAAPGFPVAERAAARRLLAEAQLSADNPTAALETLRAITDTNDAAANLLRAHAYAASDRWSEALPIYQVLNGQPGVPASAALGEAESLQALGRTVEAVPVLEKLVASGHPTPAARLRFAALLLEVDRITEAREILRETPPSTPGDNNWKHYLEARLFLLEKKPRAALDLLEPMLRAPAGQRLVGLSANLFAAATLTFAEANFTPDNPDTAIKILESFIRQNPDSPQLELVFRRLDQFYAKDKTPQEGVMQGFVRDLPPEAAALARFYITRMQLREIARMQVPLRDRRYDKAAMSVAQFLAKFPQHPLVPYLHVMRAELELKTSNPSTERTSLAIAEREFDAAAAATTSEELKAELALRCALVNLWQREYLEAAKRLKTARESARLRTTAIFDSALAWLMQENHALFEKEFGALVEHGVPPLLAGHLKLEQGLVKARAKDLDAERSLLAYLADFPLHPRRVEAELALAELSFLHGRTNDSLRHIQLVNQGSPTEEIAGQAEYLSIFIEDAKKPRDDNRVIALARSFIARHPKSSLLAEVRMKLGQVFFEREDFLNAQEQFETLALAEPDGQYAETALFLAGECGTKLFSADAHKHALELFGKVAARHGMLEPHARLQQAILKSQLGAEDDAVKIFDSILTATSFTPSAEVRYAALVGKADSYATLAKKDAKLAGSAISAYDVLLAMPEAGPVWRNQAAYKKARVLQQMGRKDEALVAFNEILDRNTSGARETFWMSRAGFEAASLLEAQQQWKSAIGIYEKMAKIPGPHVAQARQRVKALRSVHFLFD